MAKKMPDQLPADTPWLQRKDLAKLIDALGADNTRWVGGAVRDTLLGIEVDDIDCATPLLPDEVIKHCKTAGIRTVPTGIDHGTITALLPDEAREPYEPTLDELAATFPPGYTGDPTAEADRRPGSDT